MKLSPYKIKLIDELKHNLFSGDDAVVMRALAKCNEKGNAGMVEPLLAFYSSTSNQLFKKEIAEMLCNLKVSNTETFLMNALENEEMKHIQSDVLSFLWNSALQPVDDIAIITRIGIAGTYEVMLEALTLLESIDDEISEEILLESIADVKYYLGETKVNEHTKLLTAYLHELEIRLNAVE